MELDKVIAEISSFLKRKGINNEHTKTISSVHLDCVYFYILNSIAVKKILRLQNDISFLIGVKKVDIVVGDNANEIYIAIPKAKREVLNFSEIIDNKEFEETKGELKFILGQNTNGKIIVEDLAKLTHILIAGQTGSGKSVFLNSLISSIILKEKNVNFIMVDTKKVELSIYKKLNSLLFPICENEKDTIIALNWVINEMANRYELFRKAQVRNIEEYNAKRKKKIKRIIIIIDELADLMMTSSKQVEALICRIAQLSRASGIHLVIATQRPSHEVLTGLIKANLPTKIAFAVSSKVNSRVILGVNGAEQLLGKGDMLFQTPTETDLTRLQSVYITTEEIESYVNKANEHTKKCVKQKDILFEGIIKYLKNKEGDTITSSELEREFKIPEIQASEILAKLEQEGYVSKYSYLLPRKILKKC